jgi:tripartite-type tricarboxylate transporter receptor subunit TctC
MPNKNILSNITSATFLLLLNFTTLTFAQNSISIYPDKPIRFIVPFPPGGPADVQARIISQKMSVRWKQPVIVENKPGAGGSIAAEFVAKAQPDGYTLMYTTSGVVTVNPVLSAVQYDVMKDFTPVILTSTLSSIMVVNPSLKIKTISELISLAKANPEKVNYASSGNGSTSHLAMEQFNRMTGTTIQRIPYKGATPAINDLLGGNVQVMIMGLTSVMPFVNSGKLVPLGVSSVERSPLAPSVPTITSSGLGGFEASNWLGVFAPAKTPENIVKKINKEINDIMQLPDTKERLYKEGFESVAEKTPEQFKDFLEIQISKWTKIVKEANISAE